MKNKNEIIDLYISFVSRKKNIPALSDFLEQRNISEGNFNDHFLSMLDLRESVWEIFFNETFDILNNDDEYNEYSVREKMLAFYYTLFDVLKTHHDYVRYLLKNTKAVNTWIKDMRKFRNHFNSFIDKLYEEGISTGEIPNRMFFGDKLKNLLWPKLIFVLKFWINDNSSDFEKTDEAIEKSVHLTFDILSHNAIDSAIDLGKLIFKSAGKRKFSLLNRKK